MKTSNDSKSEIISMRITVLAASIFMALSLPVTAQDFDKGLDALIEGDFATALEEWKPLAEQDHVLAQRNLGYMYANGEGVLQDDKEAVKWFRLAADQGNADAQYSLAVKFEFGGGVTQDFIRAHMWYNIASANGNAKSGTWRDELAQKMNQNDISNAQSMARICMESDYKDCG